MRDTGHTRVAVIGGGMSGMAAAFRLLELFAAREELGALLGLRAEPLLTHVRRWSDSMPQYDVGHLDRVAEIERKTQKMPGLALAGAAYRGVDIPDCIRSSEHAAETILAYLSASS